MTPSIRKYHRLLWRLLAFIIPLLFVAALSVLPGAAPTQLPDNYQPTPLREVWKTAESEVFVARWRTNNPKMDQQLEIEIKKPLTVPAALVYLVEKPNVSPSQGTFIGSLAAGGIHRFNLGSSLTADKSYSVLFFDPIKNYVFERLSFPEGKNHKIIDKQ